MVILFPVCLNTFELKFLKPNLLNLCALLFLANKFTVKYFL